MLLKGSSKKMRAGGEVEANPVEKAYPSNFFNLNRRLFSFNENNFLLILGNLGQSVQHSISKRHWYTLCSKECDRCKECDS